MFLEKQGYLVLRFWNNDVLESTDAVLLAIAEVLASKRLRISKALNFRLVHSLTPALSQRERELSIFQEMGVVRAAHLDKLRLQVMQAAYA